MTTEPEDHYGKTLKLVRADLEKITGSIVEAMTKAAETQLKFVIPLGSEEVMEHAYHQEKLDLRLMGNSEAADFLGVTRSRILQLRNARTLRFPKPLAELAAGPVWLAVDIERWARSWRLRKGTRT